MSSTDVSAGTLRLEELSVPRAGRIDTDPRLEERGIDREEFRAAGALREQAAAENARRLFDAWLRAWANGG